MSLSGSRRKLGGMGANRVLDERRHPVWRSIPAAIIIVLERGLDFAGWTSMTVAVVLWVLAAVLAVILFWPWLRRIRIQTPLRMAANEQHAEQGQETLKQSEGARLRELRRIADQLKERLIDRGTPLTRDEDPHIRSKLQKIGSAADNFEHRGECQEALRGFYHAANTMLRYKSYKQPGGIQEFSSREEERDTRIALEQSFLNLWRAIEEFSNFDDVALTSNGLSWEIADHTEIEGKAEARLRVWPTGELPQPLNLFVTCKCQLESVSGTEVIPNPSRPDEKSKTANFHIFPSQGKRFRLRLVSPKLVGPAYINMFLRSKGNATIDIAEVKRELAD